MSMTIEKVLQATSAAYLLRLLQTIMPHLMDLICRDQELGSLPLTCLVLSLCLCKRKITKTRGYTLEKRPRKIFGSFTRANVDLRIMILRVETSKILALPTLKLARILKFTLKLACSSVIRSMRKRTILIIATCNC